MAKFHGVIGYVKSTETSTDVWEPVATEHECYGDVVSDTRRWQSGQNLNDDLVVNERISIVADSFANQNIQAMKYVKWMGVYWDITSINVLRPRIILTLGGVYNGKKV